MAKTKVSWLTALFATVALAAPVTYTLTAMPVTKYTDGTTITVPVTYNFYSGDCVNPPITVIATGSVTPDLPPIVQPDGAPAVCIYSTAVADGVESKLTPNPYTIAARPLPKKTPMAPAGVIKK